MLYCTVLCTVQVAVLVPDLGRAQLATFLRCAVTRDIRQAALTTNTVRVLR